MPRHQPHEKTLTALHRRPKPCAANWHAAKKVDKNMLL
jgi:hypothetical protein